MARAKAEGDVERCFLGIPLDDATAETLLGLQVRAAGIRSVPREQLHLTVHFLGERDRMVVAERLRGLSVPRPRLAIGSLGTFEGRNGAVVLWAGVAIDPSLTALWAATAEALAPIGFVPEARAWRPHITLGRAKPGFEADGFLTQPAPDLVVHAPTVQLYTSVLTPSGPVYEVVESFPLT